MRHPKPLRYVIDTLPPVPPVLRFMQAQARLSDHDAYGTLNMGAGFALYVAARDVATTIDVARACGVSAWHAGRVEAGDKALHITPLGLHYGAGELALR